MVSRARTQTILRHARRRRQRGASVFIVVMVMTLLAAIGIFAVRATSLVDLASGFNRQALQTSYVSQYGTMGVVALLGSGAGSTYVNAMYPRPDVEPERCRSNGSLNDVVGAKPSCAKLFAGELQGFIPSGDALFEQAAAKESGSFGPTTAMSGDFVVEMTDPIEASPPIAGMDQRQGEFQYVKVTLTTIAQMRLAGINMCTEAAANSAGQQSMRAHAVVMAQPGK